MLPHVHVAFGWGRQLRPSWSGCHDEPRRAEHAAPWPRLPSLCGQELTRTAVSRAATHRDARERALPGDDLRWARWLLAGEAGERAPGMDGHRWTAYGSPRCSLTPMPATAICAVLPHLATLVEASSCSASSVQTCGCLCKRRDEMENR